MAEPVEVAIEAALLARAQTFATAQSLAIAMPNVPFTPPTASLTAKWLKATILPAPAFGLGVDDGSDNQYYGVFQIDVFFGAGAGELAPKRIAAAIALFFKRGTVLRSDGYRVDVSDVPRIAPSLLDDAWWQIPVSIPFRCFSPNQ